MQKRMKDCCDPSSFSSGRRDLNPRPSPWQGDALPLSHTRILQRTTEGADEQSRTVDPTIFSRVLYQLSYVGDLPPRFEQGDSTEDWQIVKRINVKILTYLRKTAYFYADFAHAERLAFVRQRCSQVPKRSPSIYCNAGDISYHCAIDLQ